MTPWERYGAQPAPAPAGAGPWAKYAAPATAPSAPESWGDYFKGLQDQFGGTWGDEVRAAGRATGAQLAELIGTKTDDESWLESYRRAKGEIDADDTAFRERHPGQALAANVAGGFMAGPGAAGAAQSFLRATGANAATGAISGVVSGAGTGDTLEERGRNAAASGAIGLVVGGAAPAVSRAVGAGWRAGRNMFGLQDSADTADRLLTTALRREGLTPDEGVDLVRVMQDNADGAPVSIADVGRQTQRLARAAQTTPSHGASDLENFVESRRAGAGERMVSGIRRRVGSDAQNMTEDALRQARQAQAEPLYQQAFAAAPIHNDRTAQMVADPIVRQGIRRGLEVQRLEALARNEPFNPTDYAITGFDDAGDPILDQVPNMRLLDAAKRGLDDILEQYRDTVTGRMRLDQRGRAIDEVRRSLIGELDNLNPDYKAARAAWAGPSASLDAIEAGRSFMRGDAEDVTELFNRLAPGDRDFFLIGLSRELRDMVDKRPTALSDATSRIMRPAVRQRLEAFLGRDQSSALDDLLNVERQMVRTDRTATGGSPTGRIEAEQGDAQAQEMLGFLSNLLRGNWGTAAGQAVRRGQGMNEATADELAQMLTAWTPEDLRRLAGRLNESELRRLAAQSRNRAAGRAALIGTTGAVPAAMEDRR